MKIRLALFGVILGAGLASAATLRPSMIVYGIVRDSYGIWLSPESASVSAFLSTNEVARTTIRTQPNRANYRFEVNVSDPLTAALGDVTLGSSVGLRVRMGNALQPFIGANSFTALGDGKSVRVDLQLGVDSDGDGLPDDWERMVMANSGGAASNLSQIGPGKDLDGDGLMDDQEYLGGTFAFLPGDELKMSSLTQHSNGRLSFAFYPVPGAIYWVETTPSLTNPQWTICPIALTETGQLMAGEFNGGSQSIRVYLGPVGPTHFYRLRSR